MITKPIIYCLFATLSCAFLKQAKNDKDALIPFEESKLGFSEPCSGDIMSCSKSGASFCCSPENGNVVLALQNGSKEKLYNSCDNSRTPKNGCDAKRVVSGVADTILKQNTTVYDLMKTFWPSNQGDDNKFWTHEWNKHGTCVSTLDPKCYDPNTFIKGEDIVAYFSEVLELTMNYDIYAALEAKDIIPITRVDKKSKLYSLNEFKEAIKDRFKEYPSVHCIGNRLNEIRLYFQIDMTDSFEDRTTKLRSDNLELHVHNYSPYERSRSQTKRADRTWRHDRYSSETRSGRSSSRSLKGSTNILDRLGPRTSSPATQDFATERKKYSDSEWQHDKYKVDQDSDLDTEYSTAQQEIEISGIFRASRVYEEKRALFVSNFERNATEQDLIELFERVGPIEYVIMGVDINGRLLCNAEVVYKSSMDAKDAVHYIPEVAYGSKIGKLIVSYSSQEKNDMIKQAKLKSSLPEPKVLTINERLGY
ncbi:hypothetical protein BB561_001599 [Smittium simulii]|uniref:ribonuclease T2 n=1 Tax=Smittium simulii TaxID=133385 RepID=A0A2T9YTY7_9FUNG|nr:hypothetical protein BB561_001599 [Smittium simulii]